MKRIALKIDVDTWQGTHFGVPALLKLLQEHVAKATFFFSLGPDQSGLEKRRDSLKRYYRLRTRLSGNYLPAPDIGKKANQILWNVHKSGFEVGIHAWNRYLWEKKVQKADNAWIEGEMSKAALRFKEIFADPAKAHAAAGWRMNRHALRLTQRLGFDYASDSRGHCPFLPVIDGEVILCPQLPTTLPTLDEYLAQNPKTSTEERLQQWIDAPNKGSDRDVNTHVFTLRAELEGMSYLDEFSAVLSAWRAQGWQMIGLGELAKSLNLLALPHHQVAFTEIPGRRGWRMVQGESFP